MRAVVQRVSSASVISDGVESGRIGRGLVILLGIEVDDTAEERDWLVRKLLGLRIFNDEAGLMDLNLAAVDGRYLVVSQFTLLASIRKGNRPSYLRSARPAKAVPHYEAFVEALATFSGTAVATGVFGANMQVSLVNDGPVTLILDTRLRE